MPRSVAACGVALATRLVVAATALAVPSETALVSERPGGGALNGVSQSSSSMSANGRFVAFATTATNIVPADTSDDVSVYRRDMKTGDVVLVSRASGGQSADDISYAPSISANGSRVAFVSAANNLATGEDEDFNQIFIRAIDDGTTRLVSQASGQVPFQDGDSSKPSISPDGGYVSFSSEAPTSLSINDVPEIYLRDVENDVTHLVSQGDGFGTTPSSGYSENSSVSRDGDLVAFDSSHPLGEGTAGAGIQTFVRDIGTGQTSLVSVAATGQNDDDAGRPSITPDGTRVAFAATDKNLVDPPEPDLDFDVFVRDLAANETFMVGPGQANPPEISANGEWVTWNGYSLLPGDPASQSAYVGEVETGEIRRVSRGSGTAPDDPAEEPAFHGDLSADGSYVTFSSSAANLVKDPEHSDQDVFRRDLRPGRCARKTATLTGTTGADRLRGTQGRDVILGLGGKDTILGRGGRDVLCGSGGRDKLRGGPGRDRLSGGPGRDDERQ